MTTKIELDEKEVDILLDALAESGIQHEKVVRLYEKLGQAKMEMLGGW